MRDDLLAIFLRVKEIADGKLSFTARGLL